MTPAGERPVAIAPKEQVAAAILDCVESLRSATAAETA